MDVVAAQLIHQSQAVSIRHKDITEGRVKRSQLHD
jgi:hypothetical protein